MADITVRCGEWDLKNDVAASTNDLELVGHQDRPAKSISVHPRYSGAKRLYNDVAVIHLSEPYEISQNLNAIPLAESPGFMKLCFSTVHKHLQNSSTTLCQNKFSRDSVT